MKHGGGSFGKRSGCGGGVSHGFSFAMGTGGFWQMSISGGLAPPWIQPIVVLIPFWT